MRIMLLAGLALLASCVSPAFASVSVDDALPLAAPAPLVSGAQACDELGAAEVAFRNEYATELRRQGKLDAARQIAAATNVYGLAFAYTSQYMQVPLPVPSVTGSDQVDTYLQQTQLLTSQSLNLVMGLLDPPDKYGSRLRLFIAADLVLGCSGIKLDINARQ